MKRDAVFSEDRTRRYLLVRDWSTPLGALVTEAEDWRRRACGTNNPRANFIMLNPSDAGEVEDDPTIRKCVGFSKRWGFASMSVTNLIPIVSSDPWKLPPWRGFDLKNVEHILAAAEEANTVVVAWGSQPPGLERLLAISEYIQACHNLSDRFPLYCIGTTARGRPLHPSRAAYTAGPVLYRTRGAV